MTPTGPHRQRLAQIEASTDWSALVALALASPPNPGPLRHHLDQWAVAFQVAEHGPALPADLPAPVREFFALLVSVPPRRGRPRCDQARLLAAVRAWQKVSFGKWYEQSANLSRLAGAKTTRSQDPHCLTGPAALARAEIEDATDLSESRIADLLGHRKPRNK